MVEGGGGPEFPVLFYDGEREMSIGDVRINPTLEYKPFQHMISQKIGISPNQISIYLVDRRKKPKSPFSEDRRRIPITGKVNFGLICRQKECCFLVVLKRSRKSRSRRDRVADGLDFSDFLPEKEFPPPIVHSMPDNLILLRRNQQVPFHDQISQSELAELNDRLQRLRIRRENYQAAMAEGNLFPPNFGSGFGPNQIPNADLGFGFFPNQIDDWYLPPPAAMMMTNNDEKAFCEECVNAAEDGRAVSFHPCVNDAVISTFTGTRLGPICRPSKA